jgi:1,4-dihydroxy-2-naphthoate polyprenyltransferase
MHTLGVAMAYSVGWKVDLGALVWGQLTVTTIQLMTHYSNEYFDLAADRANATPTRWAGGSRVLPEGRLAPHVALAAAMVLAIAAVGCALVLGLLVRPGPASFVFALALLVLAWSYSGPPLRLEARGLGELTTALIVPVGVPLLGYYLQTGVIDPLLILVVIPLGLLQFCMLLLIEFPDLIGDAAAGKRTLVVRLGAERAAGLYLAVLIMTYGLIPMLGTFGFPWKLALADALGLPVAIWLALQMLQRAWADPKRWNALGFWGIALLMGTATADLVVLIIG